MYILLFKRHIFFFIVCILGFFQSTTILVAQTSSSTQSRTPLEIANEYLEQATHALQERDAKTALPLVHIADSIYQKLQLPENVIKAKLLEYKCLNFLKPVSQWTTPLYQALPFEKTLNQPSITKVKLYAALSTTANINNQPVVAHYYGTKALQLLQGDHLKEDPEYLSLYMSILYRMGKTEEYQYNYKKAESFYLQSLEKARQYKLPFYLSYGGLFKTYTLTNQHEKIANMAKEFEAQEYAKTQPLFFVYDFYSYHIDYLIRNRLYKKALEQSLELKKLLTTDAFKSHFSEWFLSERIADIHNYQGNYQEAINELLSTKALQESLEIRNTERAALFIKLAKNYLALKEYRNARYYCEEALIINTGIASNTTSFHTPLDIHTIEKAPKNILLDNLLFKANLSQELYTNTEDSTYLKTKRQSYETAHELIKIIGSTSDEDAFLDESQFKNVYGNLMHIYHKEWKTKGTKSIFKNALQLRLQSQYVTILNELKKTQQHEDIATIPFVKNIKDMYQNYNTVYYFWGQDAIYVLNVYKDIRQFDEIPLTKALEAAIDQVSLEVRKTDTPTNKEAHQRIYNTLFEKYIQPGVKTAVLLDDKLHLIPVGSLWIEEEGTYLLEKTSILHITTAIPKREMPTSNHALLMAPFASKDGIFSNRLFKSADEIKAISPYFDHDSYLDQQATKNSFLSKLETASIIHLATHATANTEDPLQSKIQFYEEETIDPILTSLTLPEIYDLELHASLVTLSACETGIGKEIKGKGVQSMANAFIHAGASSTVMSLWKVPDTETSTIMTSFYKYLHEGIPKDEALRQSKLDYLNTNTEYPALKHPYYWSGFVISGDPTPIHQNRSPWKKWVLIIGSIFLLLFIVRKPLFQRFQ